MVIQSLVLDVREITMPLLARQRSRKIADKQAHRVRTNRKSNAVQHISHHLNSVVQTRIFELFEFAPREDRY